MKRKTSKKGRSSHRKREKRTRAQNTGTERERENDGADDGDDDIDDERGDETSNQSEKQRWKRRRQILFEKFERDDDKSSCARVVVREMSTQTTSNDKERRKNDGVLDGLVFGGDEEGFSHRFGRPRARVNLPLATVSLVRKSVRVTRERRYRVRTGRDIGSGRRGIESRGRGRILQIEPYRFSRRRSGSAVGGWVSGQFARRKYQRIWTVEESGTVRRVERVHEELM